MKNAILRPPTASLSTVTPASKNGANCCPQPKNVGVAGDTSAMVESPASHTWMLGRPWASARPASAGAASGLPADASAAPPPELDPVPPSFEPELDPEPELNEDPVPEEPDDAPAPELDDELEEEPALFRAFHHAVRDRDCPSVVLKWRGLSMSGAARSPEMQKRHAAMQIAPCADGPPGNHSSRVLARIAAIAAATSTEPMPST